MSFFAPRMSLSTISPSSYASFVLKPRTPYESNDIPPNNIHPSASLISLTNTVQHSDDRPHVMRFPTRPAGLAQFQLRQMSTNRFIESALLRSVGSCLFTCCICICIYTSIYVHVRHLIYVDDFLLDLAHKYITLDHFWDLIRFMLCLLMLVNF